MLSTGAAATEKDDITNRLIERLKDLIARRVLVPGSKLPPERELAPAFGVSRSSLRHALKALEIMGVLTQRVGDGWLPPATVTHGWREAYVALPSQLHSWRFALAKPESKTKRRLMEIR